MHLPQSSLRPVLHSGAVLAVIVAALVAFVSSIKTVSSQTPSSTQEPKQPIELVPPGQEKRLYVMVRKEIPLKFKVENVNSKRWAHDLEIEVTNTSGRPIYFFHFYVTLPEITGSSGNKFGFWMHYGRGKLIDLSTPLEPTDVPLLPNEKYTFKLSENDARGWDRMKEREGKPEPKEIVIEFQGINFGDGTGYDDSAPRGARKSLNSNKIWKYLQNRPLGWSTLVASLQSPASLLPVNFFEEQFDDSSNGTTGPDICGCAGSCQQTKAIVYTCHRAAIPEMTTISLGGPWQRTRHVTVVR